MTEITHPRSPADRSGTGQTAKEQARTVGETARQAGGEVAHSAAEQGRHVAGEAQRQARNLVGEARGELRQQAGTQQKRAAGGLRAVGGEIRTMARQGGGSGTATDLAHQASDKIEQVANWLESREPGQMLDEVKQYARRHPGTFLAGAALLGVLAGRLTRNLAAESGIGTGDDGRSGSRTDRSTTGPAASGLTGYTGTTYPEPAYTDYTEPAGAGSRYADPAYPDPAGAGASPTDAVAGDPEYTDPEYTDPEYGGTVYRTGATTATPPAGGVAAPLVDPVPTVPTQPAPATGQTHRNDPGGEVRPS